MKRMKQQPYFTNKHLPSNSHGGSLSIRKRKSKRPISVRRSFHVVLRTDFATGKRYLLRHKNLIYKVLHKASKRFGIKIYQEAICGNHIHLHIKGRKRIDVQNFFRVVAGHIAQQILEQFPILESDRQKNLQKRGNAPSTQQKGLKYERKFWDALIYSRLVAWGRDFANVMNYIEMNTFEAEGLIPYQKRKSRYYRNNVDISSTA